MVVHNARRLKTAKLQAARARARGLRANIYKNAQRKYKVSVTRK